MWDLRAIREGLKRINLDWNAPDFPPESKPTSATATLVVLPPDPVQTAREQTEQLQKYPARGLEAKAGSVDLSLHYDVALTNMPPSRPTLLVTLPGPGFEEYFHSAVPFLRRVSHCRVNGQELCET